jgi:tetratricopeptide (TPR) repeat protein
MTKNNLRDFMKLWDYGNPEETEKKFRGIEPEIKTSGNTSYYAELMTQVARTQSLQRKFKEAHEILDYTEKMLKDDHHKAWIRYFLERGRTYNSSKVYDKARELFLMAYELGKKSGEDDLTIDAAHMMGIVEKGDESLKWNEIAMKHAEETKDEKAKGWLGSLYNNTAWTCHDMGNYDKAMELFEKNVVFHTKRKSKDELSIAKWCVARTLRSMGKIEEALKQQEELLKFNEEQGVEGDGYIYEELGECLLLLGRAEESKPNFKKAYEILSQDIWLAANEQERLERLKKLGE